MTDNPIKALYVEAVFAVSEMGLGQLTRHRVATLWDATKNIPDYIKPCPISELAGTAKSACREFWLDQKEARAADQIVGAFAELQLAIENYLADADPEKSWKTRADIGDRESRASL